MNIAMLIAGGKGVRMNQDIPKQFLNINDKPVIVSTDGRKSFGRMHVSLILQSWNGLSSEEKMDNPPFEMEFLS